MKRVAGIGALLICASGASVIALQEAAKPSKEHEWLRSMVGKWDSEVEMSMGAGQPPMKSTATESVRALGGLWIVSEQTMDSPGGESMSAVLTLGYDPEKKKFVGTWVDSMTAYLWVYQGSLDAAGKVLTLETEGPSPMGPGKTVKFRETLEFKGKDEKVFTSSMLGDDGKWITFVTAKSKRKG